MLKEVVSRLICPTCLDASSHLAPQIFREGISGRILDGVLICDQCREWYPIEDGLLELVEKALITATELGVFYEHYRHEMEALELRLPDERGVDPEDAGLADRLLQKKHFDWYAANDTQTYDEFKQQPLWQALGEMTIESWKSKMSSPAWLLDIGCANGVSSFPFARPGNTMIGLDISKGMIRQAIEVSRKLGLEDLTTFIVADGCKLPFKSQVFDYVLNSGSMHHLPHPRTSCRNIQRILKPAGIHFASENNKSVFRPIFDLMMKLWPIWSEEAGEEPMITRGMIEEWLQGLPVEIKSCTRVFLPPHLVNLLGNRLAYAVLACSDKLCNAVPGLRNNGGISLFEISKK